MGDDVKAPPQENSFLYVAGSKTPFRCECGCNVFAPLGGKRYRCNSCRAVYLGE